MSHSDDLGWLPPDGVQLRRGDLERILVALQALIDGTDPIEANRSHVVEIAHTRGSDGPRGHVMAKSRVIEWLEQQTGQEIEGPGERADVHARHLSVRLTDELGAALDAWARERGISVSHLVRELLAEAVAGRRGMADLDVRGLVDRLEADVAEVTRRLAG